MALENAVTSEVGHQGGPWLLLPEAPRVTHLEHSGVVAAGLGAGTEFWGHVAITPLTRVLSNYHHDLKTQWWAFLFRRDSPPAILTWTLVSPWL